MLKILAATDFSPTAELAVQRAAQIAAAHSGSQLTLLHVMGEPGIEVVREMLGEGGEDVTASWRVAAEQQIGSLARELRERFGSIADVQTTTGRPSQQIKAVAERFGAELVVVGATGEKTFAKSLLGSTVEKVVRNGDCPTLAVKRAVAGPYKVALVPVDLSDSSLPTLELAIRLFPEAEILVLHAFHVPFESKLRLSGATERGIEGYRDHVRQEAHEGLAALMEKLGAPDAKLRTVIVEGSAIPAILEQESALGADVIVVGKHGRSRMANLIVGSVTERILEYATADVLVVGVPGGAKSGA